MEVSKRQVQTCVCVQLNLCKLLLDFAFTLLIFIYPAERLQQLGTSVVLFTYFKCVWLDFREWLFCRKTL